MLYGECFHQQTTQTGFQLALLPVLHPDRSDDGSVGRRRIPGDQQVLRAARTLDLGVVQFAGVVVRPAVELIGRTFTCVCLPGFAQPEHSRVGCEHALCVQQTPTPIKDLPVADVAAIRLNFSTRRQLDL